MKKQTIWIIVGAVVIVIALIALGHKTHTPATTSTAPETLAGIQTGEAPWIAEIANLRERLKADNLPALSAEGTALHIHQHLDLYVHGKVIDVPASIGINEAAQFISPIHVHDTTGVIHVESPTIETFTLGQFFDVWGVKFTNDCIGGYCTDATNSIQVYVNGVAYSGDFRSLALASHQEIVIAYGTADELPNPIPKEFTFPAGY